MIAEFGSIMHSAWIILWLIGAVPVDQSPESRAVAFLAREVPSWQPENRCYSCHNNGDGARALFRARRNFDVPEPAIQDTLLWLARPDRWEQNKQDGGAGDRRLARLQFAVALEAAVDAGLITDRQPLHDAATLVAADQQPDGSWPSDSSGNPGSPVTYGPVLATVLAERILIAADAAKFAHAIARADAWLTAVRPKNLPDAAALLLRRSIETGRGERANEDAARALIARGQSADGGWGPFANAPPEPFDTAIVLVALASRARDGNRPMIERGRRYLIEAQLPDGSWPETTRPAGAVSYAQRISTTAWATLALLETHSPGGKPTHPPD